MSTTNHAIYGRPLVECRMYPDEASAEAEDPMTAEDRHIKSITLCMSTYPGSSQTIVAYDIRENVCNE